MSLSEKKNRLKALLFNLLCGVNNDGEQVEERRLSTKQHLQEMYAPERSLSVRILLGVGMVTIVGIGVFMFLFWSVYKFDTNPFYPEGALFLLPGDGALRNQSAWQN